MVQGGDPTNSGSGGKSIWERPFKDELHGRIKFNHRGQLAMANENKPNTNQSQFFLTLGACEWLDRKHTIFGKVTGNTIFNLLRMSEAECDNEVPLENIVLKSIEVLWNPFDDIIPRNTKITKSSIENVAGDTKKKQRKGNKDLKLLSFGEEVLELDDVLQDDDSVARKIISAHDVLGADEGRVVLSSEIHPEVERRSYTSVSGSGSGLAAAEEGTFNYEREEIKARKKSSRPRPSSSTPALDRKDDNDDDEEVASGGRALRSSSSETTPSAPSGEMGRKSNDKKVSELDKIKMEINRSRRAVKVMTGEEAEKHRDDEAFRDLITPLERQRQRFLL